MSADRPAHPDDAAQIRHLHRTMDLVATRSATTSDWAEVEARVLAGETGVVSIDGRRRRGAWLATAAVLVVAAAIAAAVVATRTDPDDGRVRTSQLPEGSSITTEVTAGPTTSSTGATTSTTRPNARLQGQFPDGAGWTVERDPEHGLCAVLAERNVGCDDVGPVVPADADPSTVRWGLTGDRWLAYATLPEGATGVLITPLEGAPTFSDPRVDLTNRLWGAGGDNPDQIFAIGELFRVRYRLADGTLLDAPTVR